MSTPPPDAEAPVTDRPNRAAPKAGKAARAWALGVLEQPCSDATLADAARRHGDQPSDLTRLVHAVCLARAGRMREAAGVAAAIDPRPDVAPRILYKSRPELFAIGRHDLVEEAFRLRDPGAGNEKQLEAARFFGQVWRYLSASNRPPGEPRGYVLVCGHPIATGLMVPIGHRLRSAGYEVCSMIAGAMPWPDDPDLAGVAGCVSPGGLSLVNGADAGPVEARWEVDWDRGVVARAGINYFTFFMERLARVAKAYRSHVRDSGVLTSHFDSYLRRSDAAISACERLLPLAQKGKPIRLVAMDTHFAPWGVVRRWCDVVGRRHGIHLVALSVGYENYFANLATHYATTLAAEDMTAQPTLRQPFLGGRSRFERYLADNPAPVDDDDVLVWIRQDRSRVDGTQRDARADVEARARETRARGGTVFAAFGKVLTDFAAPDDRGHTFADLKEWLRFLVNTVAGTEHLLIVKPHPHELRPEVADPGTERLRDALPAVLPPNVVFLDHGAFNAFELAGIVDLGLVWNGTVAVEFPVLGRPIVAESVWAANDYPIGLDTLATRAAYAEVLAGRTTVSLSAETRRRAAAFLRFLRSPEVAIPFGYMTRAATNNARPTLALVAADLDRFLSHGDPNVDRAASRFFEFAGGH
jgi:capsular polysaccharide export protein